MSARERTDAGPTAREVREAVRTRLSGPRLVHVESVARTARGIAARGDGSPALVEAAERAAWWHDALKPDGLATWRSVIEAGNETPDPWADAHAPDLLHAQAAAVWAAGRGETDPEVLAAVRHHPTGHPAWGAVGRILFVADFCEPGRVHADEVGADRLVDQATRRPDDLASAALSVLELRLAWLLRRRRPVHPDGWRAWNAWVRSGP